MKGSEMRFIKIDETIIPVDNIAYIRADKREFSEQNIIVATKNGAILFFPREDPDAEIELVWAMIKNQPS
jgi:hypothetical protein